MSCTRFFAPYIEYAEEKITAAVSTAAITIKNKSAEIFTQENAQKTYASMQNLFSSCQRKNKTKPDNNMENRNHLKKPF